LILNGEACYAKVGAGEENVRVAAIPMKPSDPMTPPIS
jgi:hypothetical protein